jgi:hypothetical protein
LVFAPKQAESSPALFDQLLHSQRESKKFSWKITLGSRADNFADSLKILSKKKIQRDLQRDSKVMRKHKNFASLVETKNQHVLPSNTEKNSLQFLFNIAREFSQFSNNFLDSARDHPQIMSRGKKLACSDGNLEDLSTLEPITFLRIERFFK